MAKTAFLQNKTAIFVTLLYLNTKELRYSESNKQSVCIRIPLRIKLLG